jgi:hypothetical protein
MMIGKPLPNQPGLDDSDLAEISNENGISDEPVQARCGVD